MSAAARPSASVHADGPFNRAAQPAQVKDGHDILRPMAWGAAAILDGNPTITAGAIARCFANQIYALRPD